jgi:Flp pilus assembly protein CpaB
VRSRSNLLVLLGIAFFVVGGVIVYMLTSDDDDGGGGSGDGAKVTAVVATAEVPAGALADDLIEEGKLKAVEVEANRLVPGAIGSLAQLEGATFTQGFEPNQQITNVGLQLKNNRAFDIPEGFDAVAVQLDFVPGVAAYVSAGDRINLYGTVGAAGTGGRSELVLTNVEVLDVDLTIPPRRGQSGDDNGSATPRSSSEAVTYLLALRPDDVEKVVYLTQFWDLYATLTGDEAPPAGPTSGRDDQSIFAEEPNAAFNG